MIPKLNSYVYVIVMDKADNFDDDFDDIYTISKQKVHMKNEYAFITEQCVESGYVDGVYREYRFTNKGISWFKTLKEAREYFKSYGYKLTKIDHDDSYYELIKIKEI